MMSCPYSRETSPPVSGVGAGHPGSWQGGTCNLPWSLLRSTLAGSRSGHWSHWCWCHWSLHVVTAGVGWSAVGAGLGCWHQPAAALPPASPETQPGRLLRAGGGTPWHSGQHTTGCNTRHHTTPPHSCLAPGSWLLAHQPQHRSLQRGCSVSCTVAVWTHGMGQSRVRGCRVPNCRGAAKQWSPLASQAAPHTAAASTDRISVGRVSAGSSEHLQQLTSSSCRASWGRGWRWWRGCCWWPRSPLLGAAAAEEME